MDGPALTVLEGTVTKGVDMLLGLDVLQDWDAEIRMGTSKSITVRKKEGRLKGGNSIVIPFVSQHGDKRRYNSDSRIDEVDASHRNENVHRRVASHPSKARHHSHHGFDRKAPIRSSHHHPSQHSHGNSMATQFHRRHYESEPPFEGDDEYFSPTASDIESDLDLLEKTNPDDEDADSEILPRDFDTDMMSSVQDDIEEEEEDYLQDVEDGDFNEEHFDMSGL
jgi:hypothetical protein